LLRAPVWLYRLRLGWLLGGRFLLLRHRGRCSGRERTVVLEVVHHDRERGVYYVVAAWGERAQWLRNVLAHPRIGVVVGRRRLSARARVVSADEAGQVLERYAREHRLALCVLGRLLGVPTDDPRQLAGRLRVVALEVEG
jgi:deazaflavin-dependent oxidoreductase (nitroreductase family)